MSVAPSALRSAFVLLVLCACAGPDDGTQPSGIGGSADSGGMSAGAGGVGGQPSTGGSGTPASGGIGGTTASGGSGGISPSGGVGGQGGEPASDAGALPADAGALDAATSEPILLPPISDPAMTGPFGVARIDRVSGLATHSLFVPDDVALHGKHLVVVWTNGNGGTIDTLSYASFLEHVASHGFFVIADKASNGTREAEVESQAAAIDWALAENGNSGGDYFERLDVERIAVMGDSLGSLASFATASNEHVRTSVHFSGGITDNPVGFDPMWLQQMKRPAAFLCGGNDTTAGPSCEKDFAMAPVPVFYGVLAGASHIGPFISARGGEYGRAGVAWLRWQLASDLEFQTWFVGADCTLCASPWSAMQRDLE